MPMTPKKALFAAEYIVDTSATAAAVRAGYSTRGAAQAGYRLLQDPEVAAAIAEGLAARVARTQIDQDWVIERLRRIADSDIRRVFDGSILRRPEDLDDDTAAAIAAIDVVTVAKGEGEVEFVAKVKTWDKLKALELIGKNLGMFRERVDVEHSGGVTVVLNGDEAGL